MPRVVLADGKNVDISNVLFNKEQRINVSRTYVTTVKKAVSKVSSKFFKVDEIKKPDLDATAVFNTLPKEEVNNLEMAMPELNVEETKEEPEIKQEPEIMAVDDKKVEEIITPQVKEEKVALENVANELVAGLPEQKPAEEPIKIEVPVKEEEHPVLEEKEPEVAPLPQVDNNSLNLAMETHEEEVKEPESIDNNLNDLTVHEELPPVEEVKPVEAVVPPVVEEIKQTEVETPAVANLTETTVPTPEPAPVTEEPRLFFDGTNEINLNKVLDEGSEEKVVVAPQEGVTSLREFGMDEPAEVQMQEPVETEVKTLTRSKGFANNKFFVVIAIAFFVASCVFLGYEAFQYFQLRG